MKVISLKEKNMAKANIPLLIPQFIMGTGKMMNVMDRVKLFTLMVKLIKENDKMVQKLVLAPISMQMGIFMKVNENLMSGKDSAY